MGQERRTGGECNRRAFDSCERAMSAVALHFLCRQTILFLCSGSHAQVKHPQLAECCFAGAEREPPPAAWREAPALPELRGAQTNYKVTHLLSRPSHSCPLAGTGKRIYQEISTCFKVLKKLFANYISGTNINNKN